MTETPPHLWEVEHDFYGPEGCFWATWEKQAPYINRFDSWADFADEGMHEAPQGLNLLYRWDWHAWHLKYPEDYPGGQEAHELQLFWMMPRKGIMARSVIAVTPADEDAVRQWLLSHAEYMRQLWSPLIGAKLETADVEETTKEG